MTDPEFRNDYAAGQSDRRPWGEWAVLDAGPGFAVKRIRVVPGGVLSLQRHQYRAEQWTVVAGTARVTRNTENIELLAGESIGIAQPHEANDASTSSTLLEQSCPSTLFPRLDSARRRQRMSRLTQV